MKMTKGTSVFAMRNLIVSVLGGILVASLIFRGGCDTGFDFDFGFGGETVDMEGASVRQMTAVNLDAARNKANTRRLGNLGIQLPNWAKEIDSFLICQDGNGCNRKGTFRETSMALLQPKEVCGTACNRERNTAIILSVSAIGMYQILLWHHGKYLDDWHQPNGGLSEKEWLENLELIYKFLNDKRMQDKVVRGLIGKLREDHNGNPKQIASVYYSGSTTGGITSPIKFLKSFSGSAFGYGSRHHYSNIVRDCFKRKSDGRKTVNDTPEDLNIMRMCIFGKETGGAAHVFDGRGNAKALEDKWEKRGIKLQLHHK